MADYGFTLINATHNSRNAGSSLLVLSGQTDFKTTCFERLMDIDLKIGALEPTGNPECFAPETSNYDCFIVSFQAKCLERPE